MLTSLDVANHWPLIRRHLHIDRRRALSRGLELLAEGQATHPEVVGVSVSGRRLRALGITAGEGGNIWRQLEWARRHGIVGRYPGTGRRPAAWFLAPNMLRWRGLPWATSARDVEAAVLGCGLCRAGYAQAARLAGRGLDSLREVPMFRLTADDHLGFRAAPREATAEERATVVHNPPPDQGFGGPGRAASAATQAAPLNSPRDGLGLRPRRDDDDGIEILRTAIETATRDRLWGAGLDPLREAVAVAHDLDELGAELAAMSKKFRSPVSLAAQAPALARMLAGEAREQARHQREADERRLARLEWEIREAGAGDEPAVLEEARILRDRLGSVGVDAD